MLKSFAHLKEVTFLPGKASSHIFDMLCFSQINVLGIHFSSFVACFLFNNDVCVKPGVYFIKA